MSTKQTNGSTTDSPFQVVGWAKPCNQCRGKGFITASTFTIDGTMNGEFTCLRCDGSGLA